MLVFDSESSLEIRAREKVPATVQGAGDTRFEIIVKSGGFTGNHPRVWIARPDLEGWLGQLRKVSDERKGSAELRSMSPDDFLLVVRVADSAGHIVVEGHVARTFLGPRKNSRRSRIEFCIDFDPTRLSEFVKEFEAILSK